MDIKDFLKPGKDIVVEIEDVEYLLDDESVSCIEQNKKNIPLVELYDHQSYLFDIEVILRVLREGGVVDYLDKK